MKDLIAKLQMDVTCAMGAIWLHIDAQAARIAELEAQIAAASAPADTDKLREAIPEGWAFDMTSSGHMTVQKKGLGGYLASPDSSNIASSLLFELANDLLAASTVLQAPVHEVPDAWISVNDRLPECDMEKGSFGVEVMVWPQWDQHATLFYGCRITDKPSFYMHGTRIDGVEKWRPLPAAPVQQEGDHA